MPTFDAGSPARAARSADASARLDAAIRASASAGLPVPATVAREIAGHLRPRRGGPLERFSRTGGFHPTAVRHELQARLYPVDRARWAAALRNFVDSASTAPFAETVEPNPKIYAAPAGRRGDWIDLSRSPVEVRAAVERLADSLGVIPRSLRVDATIGFYRLRVQPATGLEQALEVAEGLLLAGEAFAAYTAFVGMHVVRVADFTAHFWGSYASLDEFVMDQAGERGWLPALRALGESTGLTGSIVIDIESLVHRFFETSDFGLWTKLAGRDHLHVFGPPREAEAEREFGDGSA